MKNTTIYVLVGLILVIFMWTRLVHLDSGAHFSEPDEWSYDIASKSLSEGPIPKVGGRLLLEQVPIFEYSAHFINAFVKDKEQPRTFLSIRLVSVIASLLLTLTVFFYLLKKENLRVALFSLILFTITPIFLFYSKLGLREMLLLLVTFWFYITFEKLSYTKNPLKMAILSGFLLGLAIAVKTTALVFLIIPILFTLLSFWQSLGLMRTGLNDFTLSISLTPEWYKGLVYNGLVLALGIIIPVVSFLPYYFLYPVIFKDRLFLTFFAHNVEGALQKLQTANYYLTHLDLWLSIPVLILILFGLIKVFFLKRTDWFLLILFMLPILLFLSSNEPRGRYFVLLAPALIIIASLGLDLILKIFSRFSSLSRISQVIVPLIFFLTILPSTQVVLESTNHSVLEQVTKIIDQDYQDQMLFSTFWPPVVQYVSGYPTARLTDTDADASRDHNELPFFSPLPPTIPTIYVTKNPAYVLIHKPLDKHEFSERKRAVEKIETGYKPLAVVSDNKANFPEKTPPYQIFIYKF